MIQIIAIIGPSASGKTTLKRSLQMESLVTYTTRGPRNTEVDGLDYLFVSREKFEDLLREGELLEHTIYHNHAYGMGLKQVENAVQNGQKIAVVLDSNGARKLKNLYLEKVLIVGTNSSYQNCKKRLNARGDDQADIRLSTYEKEMEEMLILADLIINTNDENEEVALMLYGKIAQMINVGQ